MPEIRKVLVILVITVLYSAFVFSLIYAVYPNPDYSDYCEFNRYELLEPKQPANQNCESDPGLRVKIDACKSEGAQYRTIYNDTGCATDIACNYCQQEYDAARESWSFMYFIITAILGSISIAIGLLLPTKKEQINEWIGSGLLLGGLVVIFGGTIVSWGDLHTYLRPAIMLLELLLVIWLTYRLWGKKK